jgi:hypothetical protein
MAGNSAKSAISTSDSTGSDQLSSSTRKSSQIIKKGADLDPDNIIAYSDWESDDEFPNYFSDVEGEDHMAAFPELYHPLTNIRYFGQYDDSSDFDDNSTIRLGSPDFRLESFLEHRSERLMHRVKLYRMKMILLSLAHDDMADNLALFRARQLARLKNEKELLKQDEKRREQTLAKYYRRKMRELQRGLSPNGEALDGSRHPNTLPRTSIHAKDARNRKQKDQTPIVVQPRRSFSDDQPITCEYAQCDMLALPATTYCYCHILNDPKQTLFTRCSFRSADSQGTHCAYPVIIYSNPLLCARHLAQLAEANQETREDTTAMLVD